MRRREAIKRAGSVEAYDKENDEIRELLRKLVVTCDVRPMDQVVNAAMLLGLAAMRADGASMQDAATLVREAWNAPPVVDLAEVLLEAAKEGQPS